MIGPFEEPMKYSKMRFDIKSNHFFIHLLIY